MLRNGLVPVLPTGLGMHFIGRGVKGGSAASAELFVHFGHEVVVVFTGFGAEAGSLLFGKKMEVGEDTGVEGSSGFSEERRREREDNGGGGSDGSSTRGGSGGGEAGDARGEEGGVLEGAPLVERLEVGGGSCFCSCGDSICMNSTSVRSEEDGPC